MGLGRKEQGNCKRHNIFILEWIYRDTFIAGRINPVPLELKDDFMGLGRFQQEVK